MNYRELKSLLSEKTEGLEFKREITDPQTFARSVVAMTNTSGSSRIYIGVEEDSKSKSIVRGVNYDLVRG